MFRTVDHCVGLSAAALLAAALAAGAAPAGPVSATANPTAKIEEIEKAGAALQRGDGAEALKLLQEAVKKNPSLPPARLMFARLLFTSTTREGQQQARAVLEQAAGENPDHPEVYLTNAARAGDEGRVTDQILNGRTALELAAANRWTAEQRKKFEGEARGLLAQGYERRGDWAAARTHLAALLEKEKNGQLRQRLSRALFFLDKADDAYLELQQAVKDDPTLDPPTVAMAKLCTAKGETKAARDWLEKAIKAEPNSIRVHLAYADWLLQQNEIEQAKLHADTAGKIDANSPDVQRLLGLVARIQHDLGTAEKIFRRILNDAPADFFASNQLALVLADQSDANQRSRGLQLAQVNAQANPRSADALATLGYCCYRTGNHDDALKALQAAVSGGQAAADTAYYLALVLSEKDKADEAVKLLDGALQAKGLFIYRTDAQKLLEKLKKTVKAEPAKDKK